jgi:transposase
LRTLSRLRIETVTDDAADACGRQAAVRRLRRRRCAGHPRPAVRRNPHGANFRRRARRVELHFCASDLDACFVKAYPAETTEAFLDGHVSAFAFFGGVPISILYDNLKIAVARILGDGKRQRTRAFTELVSHYLFQERFGRPGKGNDKIP